jgi:HTH-type transcriptional regulator/antitoxin HigA
MQIQPIRSEVEYDVAVARITELMGAAPGTEASEELKVLVTIVDAYESEHFPINEPDLETLRRFEMNCHGISE